MSDEQSPKALKMLEDPVGDISSGRVMKMQAFWTALALAGAGFIAVIVLGVVGKPDAASQVSNYVMLAVGSFLAVAVGAEVTQKVTGK